MAKPTTDLLIALGNEDVPVSHRARQMSEIMKGAMAEDERCL
jgi:hypothetical protein